MTPFEKKSAVAGLAIGAGSLLVAGLQYTDAQPTAPAPPQPINVNVAYGPPPNEKKDLEKILEGASINRTIEYFDSISGPPEKIDEGWRFYTIDGCKVRNFINNSKNIVKLAIHITPSCDFEWKKISVAFSSLGTPNTTTLADFIDKFGLTYIDGCLIYCGNSSRELVEKSIFFNSFGPHSRDWVSVRVGIDNNSASQNRQIVEISNYVSEKFGNMANSDFSGFCDRNLIELSKKHLGNYRVNYVEFSYSLESNESNCDYSSI